MLGLIRRFYLIILLVLSFAVPYALLGDSSGSIRDRVKALFASRPGSGESIEGITDPEVGRLLAMQEELSASGPSAEEFVALTPTISLQEALRFDLNPQWVLQRWPHVSTTRINGPLDGLRVPFMTGTNPYDIVGSLTYYFDAQQKIQRISLDGVMGDDRQLVGFVTQVYKLKPEPQAGVGIYSTRWNGARISALWVRRMPVVHPGNGGQQYEFALELNRAGNYHGLSQRLEQRLQNAHAQGPSDSLMR